jgi:hypothetical protein
MAATTTLHEERTVIREGGLPKYQVVVNCSDKGDLPDVGLFVQQIIDQTDPLQDVFVRISDIIDFSPTDGFLADRLSVVIRGDTYWRSNVLTKTYDDIDVATAAVKAIFDRVNTLVSDYKTYDDSFETPGEDLDFPSADPTYVQTLKDAYTTSYTSYEDTQTAQTAAQDDLTAAQANLAAQQTELQHWLDLRVKFQQESGNDQQAMSDAYAGLNSFVSGNALQIIGSIDSFIFSYQGKFGPETRKVTMQAGGYVNGVSSDIGKPVSQAVSGHTGTLIAYNNSSREWWIEPDDSGDTFVSANLVSVSGGAGRGTPSASMLVGAGPLDAELSALRAARNIFDAARQQALNSVAAASLGVGHHGTTSTYIGDQVTQHSTAVSLAQTSVTEAQTGYNEAQGNAQTAYTTLEQAYNDVKAVCPNWSPTPPFPPVPA